jgi:hypothetical protein
VARIVATIVLVSTIALSACDSDGSGSESPSPSVRSPNSTSPPPTSPSPEPPAEVSQLFSVQTWARGESLWLGVGDFPLEDADCVVHAFTVGSRTRGAYRTDCRSWETTNGGYDIVIFHVAIRNRSDEVVRFNLRDFLLVSRQNNASYPPVNVRAEAEHPPAFLPERGIIAPRSNLVGFLTFDGRVSIVPARISYVSRDQVLTIRFDGQHTVR